MLKCDVCGKEVTKSNYNGIKLLDNTIVRVCGKHYAQYRKFGKFLDKSPKSIYDVNDFKVEGDIACLYTCHRNGDVSGYFIIDKIDLDNVIIRKWRLWNGRFYTGVKKPVSITDYLFPNKPDGSVIDHINQKPYDNRRKNLRITSQANNTKNRSLMTTNVSGFAGIWFDKGRNKWCAEIKTNYIKCFLGRYDDLEDACYVRLSAEEILFGEFRSHTNDKRLIPLAESSKNKEKLREYVKNKIALKYDLAN